MKAKDVDYKKLAQSFLKTSALDIYKALLEAKVTVGAGRLFPKLELAVPKELQAQLGGSKITYLRADITSKPKRYEVEVDGKARWMTEEEYEPFRVATNPKMDLGPDLQGAYLKYNQKDKVYPYKTDTGIVNLNPEQQRKILALNYRNKSPAVAYNFRGGLDDVIKKYTVDLLAGKTTTAEEHEEQFIAHTRGLAKELTPRYREAWLVAASAPPATKREVVRAVFTKLTDKVLTERDRKHYFDIIDEQHKTADSKVAGAVPGKELLYGTFTLPKPTEDMYISTLATRTDERVTGYLKDTSKRNSTLEKVQKGQRISEEKKAEQRPLLEGYIKRNNLKDEEPKVIAAGFRKHLKELKENARGR